MFDQLTDCFVQLIVMIGLDIVYCVTGGKAMQYVFDVSPLFPLTFTSGMSVLECSNIPFPWPIQLQIDCCRSFQVLRLCHICADDLRSKPLCLLRSVSMDCRLCCYVHAPLPGQLPLVACKAFNACLTKTNMCMLLLPSLSVLCRLLTYACKLMSVCVSITRQDISASLYKYLVTNWQHASIEHDFSDFALQFPNFHKLSIISLLAAVMSLGYSTIAIGIASHQGKQPGVVYNMDGFTTAQGVFGCQSPLTSFLLYFDQSDLTPLGENRQCDFCPSILQPGLMAESEQHQTQQTQHGLTKSQRRNADTAWLFAGFNALGTIAFAYGGQYVPSPLEKTSNGIF